MKRNRKQLIFIFAILFCALSASAQTLSVENTDPHYTEAGFFDIHVCNWPDRPPFYMALFSSIQYANIASVRVYRADGSSAGELDLNLFRSVHDSAKIDKRVFITHLPILKDTTDGWFTAVIKMKDGREFTAKDYVVHTLMPIAHDPLPADKSELTDIPGKLSWAAVPGARYYQVFIRDKWDDDRIIFTSPLIAEPMLIPPADLIKRGGYYSWRIHARDSNGTMLLGDFNHGSLSAPQTFSVAP